MTNAFKFHNIIFIANILMLFLLIFCHFLSSYISIALLNTKWESSVRWHTTNLTWGLVNIFRFRKSNFQLTFAFPSSFFPASCCPLMKQFWKMLGLFSNLSVKITHFGQFSANLFGHFFLLPILYLPPLYNNGTKFNDALSLVPRRSLSTNITSRLPVNYVRAFSRTMVARCARSTTNA